MINLNISCVSYLTWLRKKGQNAEIWGNEEIYDVMMELKKDNESRDSQTLKTLIKEFQEFLDAKESRDRTTSIYE